MATGMEHHCICFNLSLRSQPVKISKDQCRISWTTQPELVPMWRKFDALVPSFSDHKYGFNFQQQAEFLDSYHEYALGSMGRYCRSSNKRFGEITTLTFTSGDWDYSSYHIDKHNYPAPAGCIYIDFENNNVIELLHLKTLCVKVARKDRTLVTS